MRKELEDRLIKFAIDLTNACSGLDQNYIGRHLLEQIIRSCTSAALNYGEAQAAESKKDFIHKNSIVLKELRETHVNLKLMKGIVVGKNQDKLNPIEKECNQLVAIFYSIVKTARSNEGAK